MGACKFCDDGYYPAVNVNGVIIHRTTPTKIVAQEFRYDGKIVGISEPIYKDGIEVCTRGLWLVVQEK